MSLTETLPAPTEDKKENKHFPAEGGCVIEHVVLPGRDSWRLARAAAGCGPGCAALPTAVQHAGGGEVEGGAGLVHQSPRVPPPHQAGRGGGQAGGQPRPAVRAVSAIIAEISIDVSNSVQL